MTTRFTWISSGATPSLRKATFAPDDGLEAKAVTQAVSLVGTLPQADRIRCSPDRAARETTRALGLVPTHAIEEADPHLTEIDFGRWRGSALMEIQAADPTGLMSWVTDPTASPHGGESIATFCARIALWLEHQALEPGFVHVIGPANGLRAAVLHCLQLPPAGFRRVDAVPLGISSFSCHDGQWRLQALNCPNL